MSCPRPPQKHGRSCRTSSTLQHTLASLTRRRPGDCDLQLHCRLATDGFLAGAIWYTTRRRRCQAPALRRARHPKRGWGTAPQAFRRGEHIGRVGFDPRSFFPWHGRSPVSHPTRDVPFPPRRSGEHRKGMIPARPYATRTKGEWGYSTRRLCWATCAQGRCHPKEALYSPTFTVIY